MDRNTTVGFILIALILIGYSYFTAPTDEELEKMRRKQDSIARVEAEKEQKAKEVAEKAQTKDTTEAFQEGATQTDSLNTLSDSAKNAKLRDTYGDFSEAAKGQQQYAVIENDRMVVKLSTKGGRPVTVRLKDYKTYEGGPLYLFDEDSSRFNFNFFYQNRLINTEELYFEPSADSVTVTGDNEKRLSMRLNTSSPGKYIELIYTLKGNSYMTDFDVNVVGLDELLKRNNQEIAFNWQVKSLSKERGKEAQNMASTVFFKYLDDDVDYLSETSDEEQALEASTKWISFKQQFFSAVAIADNHFDKINGEIKSKTLESSSKYIKDLSANLTLVFEGRETSFPMKFYYGPNHYQTLGKFDLGLEDQIDLGWGIFGWVNEYMVIPIFNFLDSFHLNYGIIILLLTIFIKMILFPLTYKNYKSSAKQKVLKPEIDELNAKYKDADPMKKQQALMGLYKQAGVNPMAGCVPMLLQMPILYAMFRFFPASIELRQEGFLWADDLSTYDSVMELGFNIPFYGDHVSLFTLLMAVSMIFYTKFNTQATAMSGPQASQMKIMMYIMPVFFLGFFNSYSSGLSYYYCLTNVISMIQQWVVKTYMIDEEAIHKQIQQNKKKPKKQKKSKFQKRLEEMAKQRGYNPPKK